MSNTFKIKLNWKRNEESFSYEKFSRDHVITLSQGQSLNASSAPEYLGNANYSNPEELLLSALSSCHMLTFLAIASKSGYTVDSYADHPEAILDKNSDGKISVTIINLNPVIIFSGDKIPNTSQLQALHDKAHRNCFIANSIKTTVNIL